MLLEPVDYPHFDIPEHTPNVLWVTEGQSIQAAVDAAEAVGGTAFVGFAAGGTCDFTLTGVPTAGDTVVITTADGETVETYTWDIDITIGADAAACAGWLADCLDSASALVGSSSVVGAVVTMTALVAIQTPTVSGTAVSVEAGTAGVYLAVDNDCGLVAVYDDVYTENVVTLGNMVIRAVGKRAVLNGNITCTAAIAGAKAARIEGLIVNGTVTRNAEASGVDGYNALWHGARLPMREAPALPQVSTPYPTMVAIRVDDAEATLFVESATLAIDGVNQSPISYAAKMGIPMTLAVPGYIAATDGVSGYLTWAQLLTAVRDYGAEIAVHGHAHTNPPATMTLDWMETEIVKPRALIESKLVAATEPLRSVIGFIQPGTWPGTGDANSRFQSRNTINGLAGKLVQRVYAWSLAYHGIVGGCRGDRHFGTGHMNHTNTAAQVVARVSQPGLRQVILYHTFSGGGDTITLADFKAVIDELARLQKTNIIGCVTLSTLFGGSLRPVAYDIDHTPASVKVHHGGILHGDAERIVTGDIGAAEVSQGWYMVTAGDASVDADTSDATPSIRLTPVNSFKLVGKGSGTAGLRCVTQVEPGYTYRLRFRAKSTTTAPADNAGFLSLSILTKAFELPASWLSRTLTVWTNHVLTIGWDTYEVIFLAGADYSGLVELRFLTKTNVTDLIYIDDVELSVA